MPVTATQLTSSYDNVDRTSYTTASITPTANNLVLAAVATRETADIPTLSGAGLTWVEVTRVGVTGERLLLFRALGAAPSAGAVTIALSADTATGCSWAIAEFANVDTSGTNGSGAVVQALTATSAAATTLTVTLAAFGSADNATYGTFFHRANEATTFGTGFTELSDVAGATPNHSHQTQWRNDNDTSVDASWVTSIDARAIGVEIKFAAAGNATVTPGAITSTAALPSAAVSAASTVTPATVAAPASLPATGLSAASTVSPGSFATTTALPTPSLLTGANVTPAAASIITALPLATLSAEARVTPNVLAGLVSLPQATASLGALVAPGVLAVVVTVHQAAGFAVIWYPSRVEQKHWDRRMQFVVRPERMR